MLKARERMLNRPSFQNLMAQKARLNQRRMLAQKQKDDKELAAASKELEALELKYPELVGTRGNEASDRTAGINERHRKAALEDRKANQEADREARRRKAVLAAVAASGDVSRPATPPIKDLSARVKTVSKIIHDGGSRSVLVASAHLGFVIKHAYDFLSCFVHGPSMFSDTTRILTRLVVTPITRMSLMLR